MFRWGHNEVRRSCNSERELKIKSDCIRLKAKAAFNLHGLILKADVKIPDIALKSETKWKRTKKPRIAMEICSEVAETRKLKTFSGLLAEIHEIPIPS